MLRHVAVQVDGNVLVFSTVLVDKEEVGADLVTAVVAADLDLAVVVLILGVLGHNKLLLGVRRDNYLARWSVSSPMTLGETPAPAIAKADISILESFVKRFYENCSKPMAISRPGNLPPAHVTIEVLNFSSKAATAFRR